MAEPLLSAEPLDGTCRWLTTYEHAFQTGSVRKPEAATVACCSCKAKVDYTASFVTVPYGKHGNVLPLPVFIHCWICAETLDPTAAWMEAFQKDKAAALPDPDKLKREAELNRRLNPFHSER